MDTDPRAADSLAAACEGCMNPARGLYLAACRGCAVRSLAAGPLFFSSMRAGKLSHAYRQALSALGELAAVHAEVKAVAKQTIKGSIPA